MKKFFSLLKWSLKSWPVLITLVLIMIHIFIYSCCEIDKTLANTIIGPFLQLVGGLFVLMSINENIKDLRHENLFSMFKNYLKSCPLFVHHYFLEVESASLKLTTENVNLYVKKSWKTEEEGIQEMERRIDELKKYCMENDNAIREEITSFCIKNNTLIANNNQAIQKVGNLFDKLIIENVKYQVMGILLIVYGFVVNIIQVID